MLEITGPGGYCSPPYRTCTVSSWVLSVLDDVASSIHQTLKCGAHALGVQ